VGAGGEYFVISHAQLDYSNIIDKIILRGLIEFIFSERLSRQSVCRLWTVKIAGKLKLGLFGGLLLWI
jgi:hypothetical protein